MPTSTTLDLLGFGATDSSLISQFMDMNTDYIQPVLLVGVSIVLLYAAYRHIRKAGNKL